MICLTILFGLCYLSLAKEYKAVDDLDLPSYMGKWFQVYQDNFNKLFQRNGKCNPCQSCRGAFVFGQPSDTKLEERTVTGFQLAKTECWIVSWTAWRKNLTYFSAAERRRI